MELSSFLRKYNIDEEKFSNSNLNWDELLVIYDDYKQHKESLEEPAISVFNSLMRISKVHYVRYRVKNEEHLVEKIIRKRIDDPNSNINIDNYKKKVTDLIGLRALHLYKGDWIDINNYINESFNLQKKPLAYYREGDPVTEIEKYKEHNIKVEKHRFGYRSIHYLIKKQIDNIRYPIEIQVRTIFEEAWSEIDHKIRYPYYLDNKIFSEFLLVFNRLAGNADEMGTFIKDLQLEFQKHEEITQQALKAKDEIIQQLKDKLSESISDTRIVNELNADLDKIKEQNELSSEMKKAIMTKIVGRFFSDKN